MTQHPYIAEFYPHIPSKGDEPLIVLEVTATGAQDAAEKAGMMALKAEITHPYMLVRRRGPR